MDEKKMDTMLKDIADELPNDGMDEKELERRIRGRLKAIAVRTVLGILAVILGLLLIVSPAASLCTYNPLRKQNRLAQNGRTNELEQYMRAYASVFLPYCRVYGTQVKSRGFCVYEATLWAPDATEPAYLGAPEMDVVYEVRWGRWYGKKNTERFRVAVNRFDMFQELGEVWPELLLLPESSRIYCTLLLQEAVLPERLLREGICLHWLRVEQETGQEEGMAYWEVDAGICLEEYTEDLFGRSEMSGEELREEFLADLDILLSDPALLENFDVYIRNKNGRGGGISSNPEETLRRLREETASQDAVRTRIINISGGKQEVLAYIESAGVEKIIVDYVKLSRWSR